MSTSTCRFLRPPRSLHVHLIRSLSFYCEFLKLLAVLQAELPIHVSVVFSLYTHSRISSTNSNLIFAARMQSVPLPVCISLSIVVVSFHFRITPHFLIKVMLLRGTLFYSSNMNKWLDSLMFFCLK